jgi:hypothetical protein
MASDEASSNSVTASTTLIIMDIAMLIAMTKHGSPNYIALYIPLPVTMATSGSVLGKCENEIHQLCGLKARGTGYKR